MTCAENRVIIWTIQTAEFDISLPGIKCDYTRGRYWRDAPDVSGLKEYRKVLPALLEHFKVESILWCFPTLIGRFNGEAPDEVVWELDLPKTLILERFDGWVWRDVIAGNAPLDMSKLCIPQDDPTPDLGEVLIAMPLQPDCRVRRLGTLHGEGSITHTDMKRLGATFSLSPPFQS